MMSTVSDESNSWSGTWVAERLRVRLRTTDAPNGMMLTDLVGLAVRRNPRRAQLLVSSVLGKHVPTDPRLVTDAAQRLGAKARAAVTGRSTSGGTSSAGRCCSSPSACS